MSDCEHDGILAIVDGQFVCKDCGQIVLGEQFNDEEINIEDAYIIKRRLK